MKKYKMGRKLSVFGLAVVLAVMLHAVFLPGEVSAEDTEAVESAEGQLSENMAAAPEEGGSETGSDEDNGVLGSSVSVDTATDKNTPGDEDGTAVYPIVIPLESGSPQYEQLSAFLALSADKFQIYMVTFVDGDGNQVQPGEAVQTAADIPADYDISRTVVSEIFLEGDVPQRTELSYTVIDGKAVFQTDRSGLFAVMVKKDQPQLPPSLDMTDKVERLELNKQTGTAGNVTGNSSFSSVPKTGDQAAPFLWLGASAAVSAGLLLTVIANSTKNSKKS